MPCTPFRTEEGLTGIVCTGRQRVRPCGCGRRSTLECDWRVAGKASGTCDAPLCPRCTTSPAPGKDLCPEHAQAWANHPLRAGAA